MSNAWATNPGDGDSRRKRRVIPNTLPCTRAREERGHGPAPGRARVPLASRRCNGPPRRRWVAGLRGRSATLGLRYGPDSYGRQQLRIFRNGRKSDGATPRVRGRPEGCKALLRAKKKAWRECQAGDASPRISPG